MRSIWSGSITFGFDQHSDQVAQRIGERQTRPQPACGSSLARFLGLAFGNFGHVSAVPINSIVKILCQNIEGLHPVAVLMSSNGNGAPLHAVVTIENPR